MGVHELAYQRQEKQCLYNYWGIKPVTVVLALSIAMVATPVLQTVQQQLDDGFLSAFIF
jgi:hypothetical protein